MTMARIAERTEEVLDYYGIMEKRKTRSARNIPDAISYSACATASELGVSAIITATMTGHTALRVSKYRPSQPIIAVTPYEDVARRLSIAWGVYPILMDSVEAADRVIDESVEKALQSGLVKKGDLVVIAAGIPIGFAGTTNMIKVHVVGDILVKGQGAGPKSVYGNAVVIKDFKHAGELINEGDIIVIKKLGKGYLHLLDKVSGIVVEEGGLTSYAAAECISRGIPVIAGAEGAVDIIKSGSLITLDIPKGIVFSGKANVK
jgi:pyruvate kinase